MKRKSIKNIAVAAIFTAVIAASAWISVFTPFGINLTLQLFAVCLAGFCLGVRWSVAAVAVYIAIGATGLPVFSSFSCGFGVLFGVSGGFLWGFLLTAVLCGVSKHIEKKPIKIILMILSVLLCHTIGIVQYCIVSGNGFWAGFLSASLPFLAKDLILVFLANFISKKIKI